MLNLAPVQRQYSVQVPSISIQYFFSSISISIGGAQYPVSVQYSTVYTFQFRQARAYPYRFRIRGSCPIGVPKTKLYFVGPPEAMATRTRGKHCARTHTINVYDTLIEPTRSPCFESRSHPLFESLGAHLRRLWWGWFEWAAALRAARVSE